MTEASASGSLDGGSQFLVHIKPGAAFGRAKILTPSKLLFVPQEDFF